MDQPIPDQETLAARLEEDASQFFRLFDGVAVYDKPGAIGEWSLRDLMAHIVSWHEECLWALRSTVDGTYERRDYSDFDKLNAEMLPKYEGLGAEELRRRMESTARELVAQIRGIPEDLWQSTPRLAAWVNTTAIGHYEEHAGDVRAARGGEPA